MSDINQDDIDKLLQEAMLGGAPEEAAPPPPAEGAPEPMEEERGPASQDDIDALFAAVGSDPDPSPAAGPAPTPPPPPPPPAPEPDEDLEGVANQDDIDALFSAVGAGAVPAAAPVPKPPAPPAEDGGVANQDDIDALFSSMADAGPGESPSDTETVDSLPPTPPEKSFESRLAEAEEEAAGAQDGDDVADLDALLSSIAGAEEAFAGPPAAPAPGKAAAAPDGDLDMEELLKQINEAAPPPPPKPPAQPAAAATVGAETAVIDFSQPGITSALTGAGMKPAAPAAPAPAPTPPPPPPPSAMPPAPPAAAGQRREFSVLYGAGEVESVANQINSLLSAMSEKAHGYMQAWIAADSEAKELRTRALAEERRRISLESEKAAMGRQLDEIRSKLGEVEGAKIAGEESRRTLETSFQAKVRELESRVSMLTSEADTLKEELTRARNQATGVDIESRRARFEVDRLKNEVESERMERLRIQRALENREKEIQAVQAQSSGQASSLFIDELHRLVRRLESELEARTSGAHEALKQLDRMEVPEPLVPVAANLRAALMQALGADGDPDDALKALGREAAGVRGPAAVAPAKTGVVSFETALSTLNLSGAIDVAGTLLREAKATPGLLMRKIYQCPALRRPEVADHLADLARLLEGLRTVQESADRTRGSESGESEVFYVHMFDFLHNLVRLKLVTRLTGDVWRVFLDLRGRFSFVTSDKQWAEYRDKTLGDLDSQAKRS